MIKFILRNVTPFINAQTMGGVLLVLSAALALVLSNSSWSGFYLATLQFPVEIRVGGDALVLAKPMLLWVNDLWMAVFFFLVGLEIKREWIDGELASLRQVMLPAGAALGGMVVPALIYAAINRGDAIAATLQLAGRRSSRPKLMPDCLSDRRSRTGWACRAEQTASRRRSAFLPRASRRGGGAGRRSGPP